jgi:hypothetical protein
MQYKEQLALLLQNLLKKAEVTGTRLLVSRTTYYYILCLCRAAQNVIQMLHVCRIQIAAVTVTGSVFVKSKVISKIVKEVCPVYGSYFFPEHCMPDAPPGAGLLHNHFDS